MLNPPGVSGSGRRFAVVLTAIVVLFLAQGVQLAQRMISWGDESAYVHLGYLEASGAISLFQDEMRGQRMPLPFYVLGVSQRVAGRDLLAARLTSLLLGAVSVVLLALLARRAGGELAGLLAAAFLAGQGVVVAAFSTAFYHSLVALLLVAGLVLIFCVPARGGRVAGMAVVSLLFLTRGSLWPALPAVLGYLLATSRTWRERLGLLAAATAVPLAFFASDPRHLKVLAYVPVVRPLVAPLGYVPVFSLIGHESLGARAQLLGVVRMLRMYEFWTLAGALLLAFALVRRFRGGPPLPPTATLTRLVGAFFVFIFVTHLPAYGDRFREMAAYLASFSPLVALLLGVGFARAVTWAGWGRWTRTAVIAALAVVLVAPSLVIRHPLLPSGPDRGARPLADLDRAAGRLRELIPAGAHVFLYGYSLPLYVAGRDPYLRQIHDPNSLAAVDNPVLIQRNGLWGLAEIDAWLGRDAECAVIVPAVLEQFRRSRPREIAAIEAGLRERFQRVARVEDYRWWPMEVYVRKRS